VEGGEIMTKKEVMAMIQELDNNYCSEIELLHSNQKGLMQICETQMIIIKQQRERMDNLQEQFNKLLEVDKATNARIDILEDMIKKITE
jgi:hypothetical protein